MSVYNRELFTAAYRKSLDAPAMLTLDDVAMLDEPFGSRALAEQAMARRAAAQRPDPPVVPKRAPTPKPLPTLNPDALAKTVAGVIRSAIAPLVADIDAIKTRVDALESRRPSTIQTKALDDDSDPDIARVLDGFDRSLDAHDLTDTERDDLHAAARACFLTRTTGHRRSPILHAH